MNILTIDNVAYDLNDLPEDGTDDIRYAVLDNTNPNDPDFYYLPLMFLESFSSPAMLLRVGDFEVQMPLDWSMVVADKESGLDPEILPLTSLNERGFDALVFNPLSGFKADYLPIEIVNVFKEVNWVFPKTKIGHLISVPLSPRPKPPCVFFIKEMSRHTDIIQLDKLI